MLAEKLKVLKELIDENIAKSYIWPSKALFGASVFFVKKKNSSCWLVFDYRALNSITQKDSYSIPLSMELLNSFKVEKVFTTLDMCAGYYYNLQIHKGDK